MRTTKLAITLAILAATSCGGSGIGPVLVTEVESGGLDADSVDGGNEVCSSNCAEKQCGPDRCGGSCGNCSLGWSCNSGICEEDPCMPQCVSKACGPDGCAGSCGECQGQELCTSEGQCLCIPSCTGKECGEDGCAGSCGGCADGESCDEGKCTPVCVPDCDGKECGADGCGGSCGTCPAAAPFCEEGTCKVPCVQDCTDKECGNDDCEGSCGECAAGYDCADGSCVANCEALCAGRECGEAGTDGECTCGTCGDGDVCTDDVCSDEGQCEYLESEAACNDGNPCTEGDVCTAGVCTGTLLEPEKLAGLDCVCGNDADCDAVENGDVCDGTLVCAKAMPEDAVGVCVVDPATVSLCDDDESCTDDSCDPVAGCQYTPNDAANCSDGDACNGEESCQGGQCVAGVLPDCDDGDKCTEDGCAEESGCTHLPTLVPCDDGLPCTTDACVDDICANVFLPFYCVIGNECVPSGAEDPGNACLKCAPALSTATWTWIGDGMPCGAGKVCYDGACCDHAANCAGKDCGDDGCGSLCGTCQQGWSCKAGICEKDACVPQCVGKVCGPDGCDGSCGQCLGQEICTAEGQCLCVPACAGKDCGDDGCGDSCGTCQPGWSCQADICEKDACVPLCGGKECGDDGCGGECGPCEGDFTCQDAVCVAWLCTPGQPICDGEVATLCATDGLGPEPGGILCPDLGMKCEEGECVSSPCGNGELDEGESCDDGNDLTCDGCEECGVRYVLLADGVPGHYIEVIDEAAGTPLDLFNTPFTVEGWYRTQAGEDGIGLHKRGSDDQGWSFEVNNNKIQARVHGKFEHVLAYAIATAGWVHVAWVYDGLYSRIFVAGKEVSSMLFPTIMLKTDAKLIIAADVDAEGSVTGYDKGRLDELRISSVARYVEDFPPPRRHVADGDTVAIWHFDEGSGFKVYDVSANAFKGTAMGMQWEADDCYGSLVGSAVCGDGTKALWEECDDGNMEDGDGCSGGCLVTCVPDCNGKVCGKDGCGGSCGECAPGTKCIEHECVECESAPGTMTFVYTGKTQGFFVPECVTEVIVEAWGAAGGGGRTAWNYPTLDNYGRGGYTYCVLEVTPGETLMIHVGGKGGIAGGGWNGGGNGTQDKGGGGGATDIRQGGDTLELRVLVAGGGGGGGGGQGGGSDKGPGGAGGGLQGGDGTKVDGTPRGRGGTQEAGGKGIGGGNGSFGNGGSGQVGGGSGWYGGGCGSDGGGGGGSGHIGGCQFGGTVAGVNNSHGTVVLTW